jgi:hypothetical protein
LDSDIRKLHAQRKGEEYLEGGSLEANESTTHVMKMSSLMMAAGMSNFKAKKPEDTPYQHVRDWGWRGAQGAAAGAGMKQLAKNIRGTGPMTTKDFRVGAGIGMATALGDRLWRHRKELGHKKDTEKKAMVAANPNAAFHSPAEQLSAGQATGSFENKIHTGGGLKPVQVGKKFRMPGAL